MAKSAAERNDANLDRMNRKNAAGRDLELPKCKDPERRALCEMDIFDWLRTYFPRAFYRPFTDQQKDIVREILSCAVDRRTQAIAAPRGSGKSVIARRVILFMVMTGQLRFAVIVAATGRDAKQMLKAIKDDLSNNRELREDYPEVCIPIADVARSPRKCALQTVGGEFTNINWQPEQIKLPCVASSRCSGAKIYARSLDGSIRGLNEDDERPDFILIDDPETRESAASDVQCESRRITIDQDISGLAVQGDPLGMLMLTTIQTRTCLSMEFTDPKERPAWNGKRWKAMEAKPTNTVLWEEFMLMRQQDQQEGLLDCPNAQRFYDERFDEMNAGAVVANPYAVSKGCRTALQGLFHFIADKGWDAFLTEYQNDPPIDEDENKEVLSETRILTKYWETARREHAPERMVPGDTTFLTAQIDMGKYACHWEVDAWICGPQGDAGFVVDYGVVEVIGTEANSDKEQTDIAIRRALDEFRQLMQSERYFDEGGEFRQVNIILADSGNFTDAVYAGCNQTKGFMVPTKGYGDTYSHRAGTDKILGNHYYQKTETCGKSRAMVYHLDSNHFKHRRHDAWLTPTLNEDKSFRAGALSIYWAKEKTRHHSYAKHITAEEYRETFVPGKGPKRGWFQLRANNHYGDANYMGFAALEIMKARAKRLQRQTQARQQAQYVPTQDIAFPSFGGASFNPVEF